MTNTNEAPGRDGNAATGANVVCLTATDVQKNSPSPHQSQALRPTISRTRIQHLARRIHACGPVALGYLFDELARDRDLIGTLEAYASLEPYAGFIKTYAVRPGPFVIRGGRR